METIVKRSMINIIKVDNPFEPYECRSVKTYDFEPNKKIFDYLDIDERDLNKYSVFCDGYQVCVNDIPKENDTISIIPNVFDPASIGASLTKLFTTISAKISAITLKSVAIATLKLAALYFAQVGIMKILGPDVESDSEFQGLGRRNYGFDAKKNAIREGIPRPVLYGRVRVACPILSVELENATNPIHTFNRITDIVVPNDEFDNGEGWETQRKGAPNGYTWAQKTDEVSVAIQPNSDDQHLNILMLLGEDAIEVDDIQVNDSNINTFHGTMFETRNGGLNQDSFSYFDTIESDIAVDAILDQDSLAWVSKITTGTKVQGIELGILFSNGIYGFSATHGRSYGVIIPLKVEYRPVDSTTYQFTLSGSGTNEYYLELSGGGDPSISKPENVYENNVKLNETNVGSLEAGEWDYSDNDSLGFNTLYVRLTDNADPDSKAAGYFEWDWLNFGGGTETLNGEYVNHGVYQYEGNRQDPARAKIRINNIPEKQYEVRIKLNRVLDQEQDHLRVEYEYLKEIVYEQFTYPGNSLLAIRFLATSQLNNNINTILTTIKRNFVSIYTGAAYEDKPADNPAWASWDILHNSKYGAGVGYDKIVYSEFEEWAEFCINNNLTINIYFDNELKIREALDEIGQCGRGSVVRRGSKFGVVIDKPSSAVQMFNTSNIIAGTLSITHMSKSQRANVIEIDYWDKDDQYNRHTVELQQPSLDTSSDEIIRDSLVLNGCTDRQQAINIGSIMLNSNRLVARMFEFECYLGAIASLPPDVCILQHDTPQFGFGGRIILSGNNCIEVDRELSFVKNTNYVVDIQHVNDDSLESKSLRGSSLVNSNYKWTLSGSGTNEYYLELNNAKNILNPSESVANPSNSWSQQAHATMERVMLSAEYVSRDGLPASISHAVKFTILSGTDFIGLSQMFNGITLSGLPYTVSCYCFAKTNNNSAQLKLWTSGFDINGDVTWTPKPCTWERVSFTFSPNSKTFDIFYVSRTGSTGFDSGEIIYMTGFQCEQNASLTYFELNSPYVFEPSKFYENDVEISKGLLGSLTAPSWGFGDNDSLGGNTLYVRLTDNTDPDSKSADFLEYDWTTEEPHILFLNADTWSSNPSKDSIYAFGPVNSNYVKIRLLKISKSEADKRLITAVDYYDNVYNTETFTKPAPTVSLLRKIYSLKLVEKYEKLKDGSGGSVIYLSWRGISLNYNIYVKYPRDDWRKIGTTQSTHFRYPIVGYEKQLEFSVSHINDPIIGEQRSISIVGNVDAPPEVTGFTAYQIGTDVLLAWTPSTNYDIESYEIRLGDDWETGHCIVCESKTSQARWKPPYTDDFTFHIKLKNKNGLFSQDESSVTVSVDIDEFVIDVSDIEELTKASPADGTFENMVHIDTTNSIGLISGMSDNDADFPEHDIDVKDSNSYFGEADKTGYYQTLSQDIGFILENFTISVDVDIDYTVKEFTDLTFPDFTDLNFPERKSNNLSRVGLYTIDVRAHNTDVTLATWKPYNGRTILSGRYYQVRVNVEVLVNSTFMRITKIRHRILNETYPSNAISRQWLF